MKYPCVAILFLCMSVGCWAAGSSEAASSVTRGRYLSGRGTIVPAEEIDIGSYIAQVDYPYPESQAVLELHTYTGTHQIWTGGQDGILHIGIQAQNPDFEDLQPMNVAFVIDKSGSMADPDKLNYAKLAFETLIDTVRERDFLSIVAYDDYPQTMFAATRMSNQQLRARFLESVHAIEAGGGSYLTAGLRRGYEEVLSNYRSGYTNRVFLLSDCVGVSEGILDLADRYGRMGIGISVIGVGNTVDLELIQELARRGGGSSRFLSDTQTIQDVFGTELGRMAAPAARDLEVELEFLQPVEKIETWGYDHTIEGGSISYSLPTLHQGDCETILVQYTTSSGAEPGMKPLARLSLSYKDLDGRQIRSEPSEVAVEYVDRQPLVSTISNAVVLRSGSMLQFARTLKHIGALYYGTADTVGNEHDGVLQACFDAAATMRTELINVQLRLGDPCFEDEIAILENYVRMIGADLGRSEAEVGSTLKDPGFPLREQPDGDEPGSFEAAIQDLFRKVVLELRTVTGARIAIGGFVAKDNSLPSLRARLNEEAARHLAQLENVEIIDRASLAGPTGPDVDPRTNLLDVETAVALGTETGASHVLTGVVVDMSDSVAVFARIVAVHSGQTVSATHVVIPKADLAGPLEAPE